MKTISNNIYIDNQELLWPSDAVLCLKSCNAVQHNQRAILLSRIPDRLREMETELLAGLADKGNNREEQVALLETLARHRLKSNKEDAAKSLLKWAESIREKYKLQKTNRLKFLKCLLSLDSNTIIPNIPGEMGALLHLQQLLLKKSLSQLQTYLEEWQDQWESPEALMLRAEAYRQLKQPNEALKCLAILLGKHQGTGNIWQSIIEMNHEAGRSNGMAVSTASRLYPNHPGLLMHRVAMDLYSRHGAHARRLALKARVLESIGIMLPSKTQNNANFIATFDFCGCTYLLPHLHPAILSTVENNQSLYDNLTMQMASLAIHEADHITKDHAETFPEEDLPTRPSTNIKHTLRVGLISPDLGYHPVGRFVQMLLQGGFGDEGSVYLIGTDQEAMISTQANLKSPFINLAKHSQEQQLEIIRRLDLDVAIDLAGWTSKNNGWLFARRLAPLQVNFLGYFASSGLQSMDLWIGDSNLLPEPVQEWHSEKIARLTRPFLAWHPTPELPEGKLAVPSAPQGRLTFGCFNHARKLSPDTLRTWGQILNHLPDSQLALKSFASDDPGVRQMIEKLMIREGLNPKRVVWLPTTVKAREHLLQYGCIDIALDPFPNGGCTTTCEALWMGVPVITLEGNHYVSRMASAVLHGSNLSTWVCKTKEEYIARARKASVDLQDIRKGRRELRQTLIESPLGNHQDWAHKLWSCLKQESQSITHDPQ